MEHKEGIQYEDICFVYYALPGAQGEEEVGCIVTRSKDGAVWHRFDTYSESGWDAFIQAFPPLKEHGIDYLFRPEEPWCELPLSAGHLLIGKGKYGKNYAMAFRSHRAVAMKRRQENPHAQIPRFNWVKVINSLLLPTKKNTEKRNEKLVESCDE